MPVVLRAGAITIEQLRTVIPGISLADHRESAVPKSPGMKYRHYSPHARVRLCQTPADLQPAERAAYIGLDAPHHPQDFVIISLCLDVGDYARRVFNFFRECDAAGIETIYCQSVPREGLGLALMDRLEKASH
jgi:L-threonylcarbamoyladenylate synthase